MLEGKKEFSIFVQKEVEANKVILLASTSFYLLFFDSTEYHSRVVTWRHHLSPR